MTIIIVTVTATGSRIFSERHKSIDLQLVTFPERCSDNNGSVARVFPRSVWLLVTISLIASSVSIAAALRGTEGEIFMARLRNQTDLDRLTNDWVSVVTNTMSPSVVGIWLRIR